MEGHGESQEGEDCVPACPPSAELYPGVGSRGKRHLFLICVRAHLVAAAHLEWGSVGVLCGMERGVPEV